MFRAHIVFNIFQIKFYEKLNFDTLLFPSALPCHQVLPDYACCVVTEYSHIKLDDLDIIATLGVGGFGRVELVQYVHDPKKTFALKCLRKTHIVETQQQDHVFSEKRIMMNVRSPFICR